MKKRYSLAIVGATGLVGQTLLQLLEERSFPVNRLFLLASDQSKGKKIVFNKKTYMVQALEGFNFSGIDFAFFAAGSEVSAKVGPLAAEQGCLVLDKSAYFRNHEAIPLIIPEVNWKALQHYKSNIIAVPNCSTIQLLVALKPLHDYGTLTRVHLCTYQAISGAGRNGLKRLKMETDQFLKFEKFSKHNKPIAFNVLPHIDIFLDNAYTREEMKLILETRKILNLPDLPIHATAVRVPVFYGHSEAVYIETKKRISAKQAKAILSRAAGIELIESDKDYPTALTHAEGNDAVFVGRVREDITHSNGLHLWIVSDNLRKGAALNAIQIVEYLIHAADHR